MLLFFSQLANRLINIGNTVNFRDIYKHTDGFRFNSLQLHMFHLAYKKKVSQQRITKVSIKEDCKD